jgi:hypothetical protein
MQLDAATTAVTNQGFDSIKDFRRRELGHDLPTTGGGVRQPAWQEPVKESIERAKREAARIEAENLSRTREREERVKLVLRMLEIGYKVLSKEFHPDKMGGSQAAQTRLNDARAWAKAKVM